ncbi:MAG: DUF3857 domain-containing protein [Flectobacillus sp.]|uniref:DUF3857 domain-containing protein n=1 Tax=Flectobacillus sp. TaxID=50419 RepID=UPI003B9AAF38
MKKLLLLIIFLFQINTINAQSFTHLPSFRPVTVADLQSNKYDKDSTAEAYYMHNFGHTWVYDELNHYEIAYQVFVRIKILKPSAFQLATYERFFAKENRQLIDRIKDIKGKTYNLVGGQIEETELTSKDIFKSKIDSETEKLSFVLPQVHVGSIIEYSYVVHSPIPFNPEDWLFQRELPTEVSEYFFEYPKNFSYRAIEQATEGKLDVDTCIVSKRMVSCHWIMRDIPALKKEALVASVDDYVRKLHFELIEYIMPGMSESKKLAFDWPSFDNYLLESKLFGKSITTVEAAQPILNRLLAKKQDTLTLAKDIYHYLRDNFRHLSGYELIPDNTITKVFDQKAGTGTELNLLLIALLRQVGIEAHPLIINRRGNGRPWKEFPAFKRFDYTLAYTQIQGKSIFLDASNRFLKWEMLPQYCMVGEGRLIKQNDCKWIPITSPAKAVTLVNIQANFTQNTGELESEIDYSGNDYQSVIYKIEYLLLGKEKYIEALKKRIDAIQKPVISWSGLDSTNTETQASVKLKGIISEAYHESDKYLYLNALPVEGVKEHPLPNPTRNFPVDFIYPQEKIITCRINIPDNYKIIELPKSVRASLPNDGGRFVFTVQAQNEGKTIIVSSQLQFKKAIYEVEAYQSVRQIFDLVLGKHHEQIVLQKEFK